MRYEALPLMPTTWLSLLACRSAGVASESCLSLSLINSSQYIVNTIFCAHSYINSAPRIRCGRTFNNLGEGSFRLVGCSGVLVPVGGVVDCE